MAGEDVPDEIELKPSSSSSESGIRLRFKAAAPAYVADNNSRGSEENRRVDFSIPTDINDPRLMSALMNSSLGF